MDIYYDWEKKLKKWIKLRSNGYDAETAATLLGVAYSTPYQWMKRIEKKNLRRPAWNASKMK